MHHAVRARYAPSLSLPAAGDTASSVCMNEHEADEPSHLHNADQHTYITYDFLQKNIYYVRRSLSQADRAWSMDDV